MQAAAAARVAGGPTFRRDIFKSARNGDSFSVLCHLVADADGVNKRDDLYLPPALQEFSAPHMFSSFSRCELILLLFLSNCTPLHESAIKGHIKVCRLLLLCNTDVAANDYR